MFEGKRRIYVIALLMLSLLLAVGGYFYHRLYLLDQFQSGVRIAGVAVQGCTLEEASLKLQHHLDEAYTAPVVFYAGDYTYSTVLGEVSQRVDADQAVKDCIQKERERALWARISQLIAKGEKNYPLPISYDQAAKERMLNTWNQVLGQEPVNARLDMDPSQGLIVVPEISGKTVDLQATFNQMPGEWEGLKPLRIPISAADAIPEVSARDLEFMGELASYVTWYKVAEIDRSHNLTQAANLINGHMIRPGKEFSFNKTVGPRTLATGFRDAPVIVGNTLEPGLGGGICQVSSTLYNASLLAGLEIVERHNHGLAVSYVPLGMDATVAYGLSDFRFRNNTDYPVYIRALAGGGKLTVNIYGHVEYKKNIQTSHVVDEIIPFEYRDEIDPRLNAGQSRVEHKGFPGYIVRSFRSYYDQAGQLINSELLARDRYKPFDEITYVGPPEPESIGDASDLPPDPQPDVPADNPQLDGDIIDHEPIPGDSQADKLEEEEQEPEGL